MSPSPTVPSVKWKKRKRGSSNLKTLTKKQKPYRDPDDEDQQEDEEYEEDEVAIQFDDTNEDDFDDSPATADPNSGQIEVLSEAAVRISGFPFVSKHAVNRPHSSILAVAAVERGERFRSEIPQELPRLENISHGQLQSVSVIPASGVQERPNGNSAAFVCKSPAIMEGKGVVKRFGDWGPLVLPMYADWFMPGGVHRLERHVVPHFFTGKSSDHTPERYMEVRNKIVAKYLENPCGRISASDCQNLGLGIKGHDLIRIVAFLDSWGIINYIAGSVQSHSKDVGPLLQEDTNEELLVPSVALRSFDSLIHFDKPKSKYRPEDVYLSASMSLGIEASDLDSRIRARLSEIYCSCCSKALPHSHYQSLKEADITLCVDCFHDGKFVPGHASIDFVRVDSTNDFSDLDGDSWTDQETLLLLEALEIYSDNWNEIAEHVGTKTKIQCILQFIRLPTENGLLENIELPVSSNVSKDEVFGKPYSHANDSSGGFCLQVPDSENRIPFGNSGNPIMALVAFLASAVGPRVAAACAHASLSALAKDENHPQEDCCAHWDRLSSENTPSEVPEDALSTPLSPQRVKAGAKFGLSAAAMKAKLFADHEEREIQRLAATIVNHKLKRLELKLKQFAEVETLLMKECEQVESARQRLSAERARMMSVRFGLAGTATQPADAAAHNANPNSLNSNNRVPVISASGGPSNIQAFGNNQPAYHHSPFNPRQPIFSFGPRLPLSSISPSSSSRPASTGMLPSGSVSAPYLGHPMLRSLSETNTNPN